MHYRARDLTRRDRDHRHGYRRDHRRHDCLLHAHHRGRGRHVHPQRVLQSQHLRRQHEWRFRFDELQIL